MNQSKNYSMYRHNSTVYYMPYSLLIKIYTKLPLLFHIHIIRMAALLLYVNVHQNYKFINEHTFH